VANALAEDEQMPNTVTVAYLVIGGVKSDADRVKQSAGCQPSKAIPAQRDDQGLDTNHGELAHHHVNEQRQNALPFGVPDLLGDAEKSERPYDAKD
jgi:hypothetical protein